MELSKRLNRLKKGRVFVFGTGDAGELGLGEAYTDRKKPMPIERLDNEDICDIESGGMHTIAITKSGKLWSWGCNDHGALGRTGEGEVPMQIDNLANVRIVKVKCGDSISIALTDEGKLYSWGTFRSSGGVLGFSKNVNMQYIPTPYLEQYRFIDIAAGADHCLALTTTGKVFVWGDSESWQLGRLVNKRHPHNSLRPEPLALRNIRAIGCGGYHSFAVSDTHLYVWGLNNRHQCGLGDSYDIVQKPTPIPLFEGKRIRQVEGGQHYSLVLLESGEVYAFGRGDCRQLGLPESILNQIKTSGQSGEFVVSEPTKIPGISKVKQICCGTSHAIATTEDGSVYTWGYGDQCQLGNGGDEDEPEPYKVTGQKIEGYKAYRVSAGGQFSVVLAAKH